jgi:hypothetical protein
VGQHPPPACPPHPAAQQTTARREVGGRCGTGGRMRERSGPHHDGSRPEPHPRIGEAFRSSVSVSRCSQPEACVTTGRREWRPLFSRPYRRRFPAPPQPSSSGDERRRIASLVTQLPLSAASSPHALRRKPSTPLVCTPSPRCPPPRPLLGPSRPAATSLCWE